MLVGSSIGVQFGPLVTHYVQGIFMRVVLGIATLIAALGAVLKLINILLGKPIIWLDIASITVTFTGLSLAVLMISFLFVMAKRYRNGQSIPVWTKSLVATTD